MGHKISKNTKLITGIPRSGTTLCCNLLNKCEDVVALHEPIDPHKLTSDDAHQAVYEVCEQVENIRHSLESNKAIEHGDKAGLGLDNPVGQEIDESGLRKQQVLRGLVTLPTISASTQLFVKQNALFTALSEDLAKHYEIYAIVRNPIDVLLSWMTVKLPVNRGRLPAGEKYDITLAKSLESGDNFERQITIYKWFIKRFQQAKLTVVRYEDIIATNGNALYSVLGIQQHTPLTLPERSYPEEALTVIQQNWQAVKQLGIDAGYSKTALEKRRNELFNGSETMKLTMRTLFNRRQENVMEIEGLSIVDNGKDNEITIEEGSRFNASRIEINGNNNVIYIAKNREFNKLSVNFKGNAKTLHIDAGVKNINNLKITSIRGNNQQIKIGKNFSCGGMEIQMNDGDENCFIGDDCLFSWGIKLRTSDGHSIIDIATNKAINLPEDVVIADRVWCSEDVKFLKGCAVSSDSVVGSNALVTKKFDKTNVIIAGTPARIVKENIRWDRRMPYQFNKEN